MASDIVLAYRHLYRHGLRAVQFSKPARYTLRDRLRIAFRKGNPRDFDRRKIDNTIEFLRGATRERGLEHKIVKNLILVWYHQAESASHKTKPTNDLDEIRVRNTTYDVYNHTVRMLNEGMGTCLP
ncbi:DUF1763-domain-containing protein [Glonium stellatum]|uniref:DUF1763-domain-containing protein n=1 Tax=Glonium stellatum TaxID=574774 RepID=A0A8E2JQR2_9PEZI|nr:DUF1763-domain-containing protein [Glonium stellatum]